MTGRFVAMVCALMLGAASALASGWSHYGGSPKGGQYSPLSRITKDNVHQLAVAWTYRTGERGQNSVVDFAFEANPILVEGQLYLSTGSAIVIALDPATGDELWRFDSGIDRSHGYSEKANRGVSSWIDPDAPEGTECRHRIFVGTLDARLIALDGASGKPCPGFGENGEVSLTRDVRFIADDLGDYTVTSPPVIVGGIVIVGSAIGDNRAVELEYGIVRGFDARTGEKLWQFDPVPRDPTDPMHTEWRPEQVARTGAANAWAPLSADPERGIVYIPTTSPSPDFYGGERLGRNDYANSLVVLDARTGAVLWHRQLIHHDVWDYDLAAQPALVELERDEKTIPAVIQGTKTGMIFTFNRLTGEPVFEIEERPVPQGAVEGEQLSPTQPFPVKPPVLMRTEPVIPEDAWGLTFFDEGACRDLIAQYRSEGIFTPPSLEGSILYPSYIGGINWGGVAFDPGRQILVANPNQIPTVVTLIPRDRFEQEKNSGQWPDSQFTGMEGTPYGMRRETLESPLGIPCTAPPWGKLVAVDMREGDILWERPLGTVEDITPALFLNIEYGVPGIGGPMVTAGGVIFIAAALDDYLRAFDIETGEELWKGRLPAGGQATPMSYYLEPTGQQYIVIAAGGHPGAGTTPGDYVVAFTLQPGKKKPGMW